MQGWFPLYLCLNSLGILQSVLNATVMKCLYRWCNVIKIPTLLPNDFKGWWHLLWSANTPSTLTTSIMYLFNAVVLVVSVSWFDRYLISWIYRLTTAAFSIQLPLPWLFQSLILISALHSRNYTHFWYGGRLRWITQSNSKRRPRSNPSLPLLDWDF